MDDAETGIEGRTQKAVSGKGSGTPDHEIDQIEIR
jgi:hypothetical protein